MNCARNEGCFPGGSMVKNLPANAGDTGVIPGLGRSPGEGNGNPFQYSCLGNPADWGTWWATVHGVTRFNLATKGQLSSKLSNQESSSCRPCSSVRGNSILMCSFFCPWAWEDANASGGTLCFIVISSNKGPLLNCLRGCYYYGQWTQYFS